MCRAWGRLPPGSSRTKALRVRPCIWRLRMYRKPLAALSLCAALLCCAAPTPTRAQDCSPPAIVANAKSSNMFTPEQEMVFGELSVQNMAGEIRFVRDAKLTAYLNQIGERII